MTAIPDTVADAVAVEYFDPGTAAWVRFGDAMSLGALKRNRRISAGPGGAVTAAKWRVVKVGDHDWTGAGFFLDAIAFQQDAGVAEGDEAKARLWTFNFDSDDQRYVLAATPYSLEVYRAGARVGSVQSPYDADQLVVATRAQQLDTMIGFHADVHPWRFMRQGGHAEWDSRKLDFDAVPRFDYGAAYTNGVNEVQRLILHWYTDADTFNITLDGETTNSIAYAGAGTAAAIQTALEALPSVGAGNVTVAVFSSTDDTVQFDVTFTGKLAGKDLDQMAPQTLQSVSNDNGTSGVADCATITQGEAPGEDVISDLRGWPSTGAFYQQRLVMAGLRSRPQTLLGSRLGSYFDFNAKGGGDNGAMDLTLAGFEAASALRAVFPGRHLQLFSTSGEFFLPVEPLKPFSPVKQATRRGVEPGTPQAEMDGATLYVTNGGDALAQFAYDFTVESYQSTHLSALASHLVKGVTDFTLRKARSTTQPYLGVMVTGDRQMTALVAMLEQEVAAFAPWTTAGDVIAAGAELGGDIYVIVRRAGVRCLERFDTGRMLDSSVLGEVGETIQTGLGHLEGQTVCAWVDGDDAGDFIVADGQIELPYPPLRSCEIGLLFQPKGVSVPAVMQSDPRAGASMQARVGEIAFRLGPTVNLRAGVVGGKMWRVGPPMAAGALLGQGVGEAPFAGWARITGVGGFRQDAQVAWTQERPGPLEIQELVVTVTT